MFEPYELKPYLSERWSIEINVDPSIGTVDISTANPHAGILFELEVNEARELAWALMTAAASLSWKGDTE